MYIRIFPVLLGTKTNLQCRDSEREENYEENELTF